MSPNHPHSESEERDENHRGLLIVGNREGVSHRELSRFRARCGQREPSPEEEEEEAQEVQKKLEDEEGSRFRGGEEEIVVNTWIHEIRGYVTPTVSRKQIDDQVSVLNDAFAGTGFRFELQQITCHNNLLWWLASVKRWAETQMKRSLREGGAETLNVYLIGGASTLGWATFPSQYRVSDWSDGVVIATGTLPGGLAGQNYNGGKTLIHEVSKRQEAHLLVGCVSQRVVSFSGR